MANGGLRRVGGKAGQLLLATLAVLLIGGAGWAASDVPVVGASHTPPGTVYVDAANCPGPGDGSLGDPFCTLQDGVAHVNAGAGGDTIEVAAGTYTTGAQVPILVDMAINGASTASVIITPGFDTGSSGDARGWFLVEANVDFDLSNVTLDGTGNLVYQAIRNKGEGSVDNVAFTEIKFNESGPTYSGVAIAAFGTGPVDVSNSTFDEIGRVGVLYFGTGPSGSSFTNNVYTGKGVGDWLDYALDISAGVIKDVSNNTITGNRGVASSDGSNSAGILVTTFFGAGTEATITDNDLSDNTSAIHVGFDGSDTSVVVANCNNITGNDNGIRTKAPAVDAENNWWGSADGPSGAGPGSGDSVDAGVDFDPFLTSAAVKGDCPPSPTPAPVGGIALGQELDPLSSEAGTSGVSSLPIVALMALLVGLASAGSVTWYVARRRATS